MTTPQPPSAIDDAVDFPAILERERTTVCIAAAAIQKAIDSRAHLAEPHRGSFAYDDEQYQREFGDALSEIAEAMQPLWKIAKDWSNCPRGGDLRRMREAAPAALQQLVRALEEALRTAETAMSDAERDIHCLLTTHPDDPIAESGVTVFMAWERDAALHHAALVKARATVRAALAEGK